MKHFKERIDKIFPHCRPYSCPNTECSFEGKDKQALLRHYTGKHGVLELYLKEALLAKGINYHLSDSAKRKSMNNPNSDHKAKMARLSPPVSDPSLAELVSRELFGLNNVAAVVTVDDDKCVQSHCCWTDSHTNQCQKQAIINR